GGGNWLADILVFGKRAGEFADKFARQNKPGTMDASKVEEAARRALDPFNRAVSAAASAEGPYQVQHDLQKMMQDLVGIVRREEEMRRALEGLQQVGKEVRQVGVSGMREINAG